jgi:hypothetical protein
MRKNLFFTTAMLCCGCLHIGRQTMRHPRKWVFCCATSRKFLSSAFHNLWWRNIILPKISKMFIRCSLLPYWQRLPHLQKTGIWFHAGYCVGIDVTMRDLSAEAKSKVHPGLFKRVCTSAPIRKLFLPAKFLRNYFDIELYRMALFQKLTLRKWTSFESFCFSFDCI